MFALVDISVVFNPRTKNGGYNQRILPVADGLGWQDCIARFNCNTMNDKIY